MLCRSFGMDVLVVVLMAGDTCNQETALIAAWLFVSILPKMFRSNFLA